ncbi:MAG: peptidoglycan/LPS O-acetylase OafA/YrhL [Bacteroidia bacterium]|jgi:peptidoglycan/LPS O-acetylase OafA/YrhL
MSSSTASSQADNAPGADHGGFIPSLEGMRALAVIVAVLFHLGVEGAGGGYLGIELFFVISGYIITRNILFDTQAGKFSLRHFYVRRIRRLVPALVATVAFTLLLALVWVPPEELENTARSAFFAIFSLANFDFWLDSNYFSTEAEFKPLLHTWSLSVEEQFYLLWPALLVILGTKSRRVICTVLLIVTSLLAAMVFRHSMAEAVFYLLPFRVYELMSGALVAILALRLSGFWGNLSVLLGFVGFLTATIVVTNDYTPALTAAVVCGMSLLLLLGRETKTAVFLLANRPMQWIGARSYSIYLVHWPIFVLYKYATDFELSMLERVLLSSFSLLVAVALHELVEKPFRLTKKQDNTIQKFAWPVIISVLTSVVILSVIVWQMKGLPSRVDLRIEQVLASVEHEHTLRRQAIRWKQCNLHRGFDIGLYDKEVCASLAPDRSNVLVIGDSIAADTYMLLSMTYPDIHFAQATAGTCTALVDTSYLRKEYPACLALNTLRFEEFVREDFDLVLLASTWTEERIPPLKETVDYLHSLGKQVLIFGPRAVFPGVAPHNLIKETTVDGLDTRIRQTVIRKKSLYEAMRAALPGVEIVDIAKIQCTPQCTALEGERLLYLDPQHMTQLGARRIGERFDKAFDLPGFIAAAQTR